MSNSIFDYTFTTLRTPLKNKRPLATKAILGNAMKKASIKKIPAKTSIIVAILIEKKINTLAIRKNISKKTRSQGIDTLNVISPKDSADNISPIPSAKIMTDLKGAKRPIYLE